MFRRTIMVVMMMVMVMMIMVMMMVMVIMTPPLCRPCFPVRIMVPLEKEGF